MALSYDLGSDPGEEPAVLGSHDAIAETVYRGAGPLASTSSHISILLYSRFAIDVKPHRLRTEPSNNGVRLRAMSRLPDSPVHAAKGAGRDFVYSTTFEVLSRAGFVARGLIYGIIGVLAFLVAVSDKGKLTDQEGAIRRLADKPFGTFLLVVVAIGLGGYSIWRLFRAALGHGPEASDSTIERLGGVGSGLVYAALCVATIKILTDRRARTRRTRTRRPQVSSTGPPVGG